MRTKLVALRRWAPIPIRAIIGYGFMAHGAAKLMNGPERFVGILRALHVPAPEIAAWATIGIELIGGLAVLIGAAVSWVGVPLIALLVVAAVTVHRPYGFSSIKLQAVTEKGAQFGPPGYETDLLYIAGLAALLLGGTGPLALHTLFERGSTACPAHEP
jgi:putative oxidoreductase